MPAAASSEPAHDGQCDWSRVIAGPLAPPPVILARGPMKPLHSLCVVTTPQARGEGGGSASGSLRREQIAHMLSLRLLPSPTPLAQTEHPSCSISRAQGSIPASSRAGHPPSGFGCPEELPWAAPWQARTALGKASLHLGHQPPAQPPPSARPGGSGAQFSTDVFFTRCSRASLLGNSP